ncbi:sacsin N-terminal ATP-binding-like domain-containing protein [Streptomyces pinistramenti]|uniref:sacsin N-terminal ATP-binding-like domain-containing protein n=1 Tax=Streptomyces pinistramenti TaxID=2884812 RepID=UPI001D0805EC|nr:molecular chaperone Hsp90 [Streptomyces pinistramenti]MCB5909859.1 molecular chaperone Hsp90 [Streptomyces pinistramenti]
MVRGETEGADPFGTARLRRGVLDAWAASPARFREDANAEEDLALGGYRDRLAVELAQNAADAAGRAGVPGRLRLTLHPADGDAPAVLVASNTGAPLDATGVESLSTLRASAKRESSVAAGAVGRFGVGFAAVLSVSDEPALVGRTGGVRWSLAEARELAREVAAHSPGLGGELRRRDGHVPLLRLPLPAEGGAPEGYDTAVVLPLRDGAAQDLAERLLAGIDAALLLTLPGLADVVIETPDGVRELRRRQDGDLVLIEDSERGATRWRVASDGGALQPALLADRPVEERLRPVWSVTWAVPVDADGAPVQPGTAAVVHAPTPTDEPMGLPALLIASFPLEPTRRHVAPGPLTDFLVERAAAAYATLLGDWRPVSVGTLDLVPGPLGKGGLDGALRGRLLELLPRVRFLPSAGAPTAVDEPAADGGWDEPVDGDESHGLRPVDAEVLEGAGAGTVGVLAELFPTLLPAGLERRPELRVLDVARVPLSEMVDRLAGVERTPGWWWRLYDALAGTDPDRLSGLPVPLAGSAGQRPGGAGGTVRTTIGPRQVLLPLPGDGADQEGDAAARYATLARLGLKVAHPDAVHPLLEKLGALPASPRAVLTTPQVRAAVANSLDADEDAYDVFADDVDGIGAPLGAEAVADTVLGLVRDAHLAPGDEPWLGALALPDEDGELAPAGELVYPGSAFEQVIRAGELAACDAELIERWGEQPLTAVGVLAQFALVRATDVVLDPDELEPREGDFAEPDDAGLLDSVDVWCEDILDMLPDTPVPPVVTELVAVRDLDLVDDDAWPQALEMLSRPPLRDALTAPVRVLLPDGTTESVRPYTAWWLRGHPVLDGRRPAGLRSAGGDPLLAGLYESADAGEVDAQVLRALGVRTSAAALLDEPGGAAELLGRLADPELPVGTAQLHALYGALAELDPEQVTLPDELRAVVHAPGKAAGGTAAGEARVVDAADAVVADAPDLMPLAAGRALLPVRPARAAELAELLQVRRLSEAVDAEVRSEGVRRAVPDAVRVLLGAGTPDAYTEHEELLVGEGANELDWRLAADGTLHAATLEGVAAGLAWAAGQWPRRFEVAALLEDPDRGDELAQARWFD